MIGQDQVKSLAKSFWADVISGRPGSEMEHYFVGQGHVMVPGGKRLDLEQHQQLHRALTDESHHWESIELMPLATAPEQVYVIGVVAWQASFADGRAGRIKAAVREQWLLERGDDGALRWVLYRSSDVTFASDSAEMEI
jgi:hypothetical protein